MNRVLVTGADGFLGRHVVSALRQSGAPVRTWTLGPSGDIRGDIRDDTLHDPAVRGMDAVVHCAGVINAASPEAFQAINAEGTARLAQAAAQAGTRRFVFVSSSDCVFQPHALYGGSKLGGEAALRASGLPEVRTLRPTVIYGPGDRKNVWAMVALSRRVPWVYPLPAPGQGRRQPIWVGDLARAVLRAALTEDGGPPLRHLCGPDAPTVRQMVETLVRVQGLSRRIVALPLAAPLGRIGRAGGSPLLRDHAEQLLSFEMDKAYRSEPGQWEDDLDGPRLGFEEGMTRWMEQE